MSEVQASAPPDPDGSRRASTTDATSPADDVGPTAGTATTAAPDPRRWWVLAVMSIGTLIVFLDDTVVNTALPRISVDLQASTSALQWVIDAYVLSLAGLLLLCGSIGDRYGRKRIMSAGLVVFGIAAAGAALADSTGVLIAMRALQGVGAALVLPATLSILTSVFPREERGRAIAVWTAVGGLGVGLGPVIGGALVDSGSWATAFWMFIPFVVAALAGMTVVPESRDPRRIGLDLPGAVLGTAGLTALVYGIIRGGEAGWTHGPVLASFAAAAVLLAAFGVVEARATAPMLPLRLLRQRDLTGAVLVIGIVLFAMFVTFFFLTQFFQLVQDRSAFAAGLLVAAPALGIIVGSGLAGKLLPVVGPRRLVLVMTGTTLFALVLLTQITESTSGWYIDLALIVFGLGAGLGLPTLTDTVMAAVPERDAGVGSALNDVSRQLGGALGVAVIGSLVNDAYRSGLTGSGAVPADVAAVAGESLGVAGRVATTLPPDAARDLVTAANDAYVDAITLGFAVSAAVLVGAVVVALTLLPRSVRATQATAREEA